MSVHVLLKLLNLFTELDAKNCHHVISSPEHKGLKVSFWNQSVSIVRRPSSSPVVVRLVSSTIFLK